MDFLRRLFGQKPIKEGPVKGTQNIMVYRTCRKCLYSNPYNATECKNCGAKLEALDKETIKKMQQDARIKELVATFRLQGMKFDDRSIEAFKEIGSAAIGPLINVLNDPDRNVRAQAAIVLGKIKNEHAVNPLMTTLNDSDDYVREQAAIALEQLDCYLDDRQRIEVALATRKLELAVRLGSSNIETLIAVFKASTSHEVHIQAIMALGEVGDVQVVKPLLSALKSSDSDIRKEAAIALDKITDARAIDSFLVALKDSNSYVRLRAVIALRKIGDTRAVEPLISALKDSDDYVRNQAVMALTQLDQYMSNSQRVQVAILTQKPELAVSIGSDAIPHLVAELKDTNRCVTAAIALGEIGDVRAIDPLSTALKAPHSDLRKEVTIALGKIGSARVVKPLMAALKDPDRNVQIEAAIALGAIGDVRAIDPLITALKTPHSDLRKQVAIALGKIGSAPVVKPLMAALKDPDRNVQIEAAIALDKVTDAQPFAYLIAALKDSNNPDSNVRLRAATALGKAGDALAVEPLIDLLKDWDSDVRAQAKISLEQLKHYWDEWQCVEIAMLTHKPGLAVSIGSAAVEPLIVALNDENWSVTAAIALGEIGDVRAIDPLSTALKAPHSDLRKEVTIALGKIGNARAIKALIAALGDSDISVQTRAAIALGEIGDASAAPALLDVALKDRHRPLRLVAARAAWKIDNRSTIQPLEEAAHMILKRIIDEQDNVTAWTKYGRELAETGYPGTMEVLIKGLCTWNKRWGAREILKEIKDPRSVGPLIAVYNGDKKYDAYMAATDMAATAVNVLNEILPSVVSDISSDDLYAVINLSDKYEEYELSIDTLDPNPYEWRKIDCSRIKQVAHQELAHREQRGYQ